MKLKEYCTPKVYFILISGIHIIREMDNHTAMTVEVL